MGLLVILSLEMRNATNRHEKPSEQTRVRRSLRREAAAQRGVRLPRWYLRASDATQQPALQMCLGPSARCRLTSDISHPKLSMVGEARAASLRSADQCYAWFG